MHGASYVELERAVGPEGSARERVIRFLILQWRAEHVKGKRWREKISLPRPHSCVFVSVVQITVILM